MHKTSSRFWKCYENLPLPIRKTAEESFKLLKENSRHPSLHFKKIGKVWSARVGLNHRAIAVEDGDNFIWAWIGNHDEYERIIREIR